MSKLLFKLRNVPDDEALEVRELLELNDIDYFETTPGNWLTLTNSARRAKRPRSGSSCAQNP